MGQVVLVVFLSKGLHLYHVVFVSLMGNVIQSLVFLMGLLQMIHSNKVNFCEIVITVFGLLFLVFAKLLFSL